MDLPQDINTVGLFVLLILPGLISMQVYRLLMPARALDWGAAALEGLFYGTLNLILSSPILVLMHAYPLRAWSAVWYYVLLGAILLVLPIVWPVLFLRLRRTRRFARRLQMPHPTAWDYFFDQRPEAFVLIHLKSGEMVGGYFGERSYASAFPNDGDIYVEFVYKVDGTGKFGDAIADTRGLLVRRDEYSYIEFFNPPVSQEEANGNARSKTV